MSNEFSEKKKAADTSVPASAQNRGGGAIDSPPAKRVWRKPSIETIAGIGSTYSAGVPRRTYERFEFYVLVS